MSATDPTRRAVRAAWQLSTLHRCSIRAAQDVLAEASATYRQRRADALEWARPRPGDYPGAATRDELEAADRRCRADAERYRAEAEAIRAHGDPDMLAAAAAVLLAELTADADPAAREVIA